MLILMVGMLCPDRASAVPFATSLTNANGILSFRLNESADLVRVIHGSTTNALGALPPGLHQFALGISGSYRIVVTKAAAPGFITPVSPNSGGVIQINEDSPATRFSSPRGVAINNNPASPWFGRIYVANATAGTVTNLDFGPGRTVGDGLYLLNSDFSDAEGQDNVALTAGLNFTTSGDLAPYRLTVGSDDQLYIADFGNVTGSLYVTDPRLGAESGINVLGGPSGSTFPVGTTRFHGSIAAAAVDGSLATGNLQAYVIDEDLQSNRAEAARTMQNSLWRHDIGGVIPGPTNLPTLIVDAPWFDLAGQTMDLSRGLNGYFYVNNYRQPGTDRGGLYVHDPDGELLWNSLPASRELLGNPSAPDLLRGTGGGAVSPGGDFVAVINLDTGGITVIPLVDGIPDLANRLALDAFNSSGAQGRDVAFDAAGNLYAISSGAQALRAFSPGGRTTAMTGSDGTFQLERPPGVSVHPADVSFHESNSIAGQFILSRTGDLENPLTVTYSIGGTARNGIDYQAIAPAATFPAGVSTVNLFLPLVADQVAEPVESVVLTLAGSSDYDLKSPFSAQFEIVDDDPAVVTITAVDTNSNERLLEDLIVFRIDRLGETNSELYIICDTREGTAVRNEDFQDGLSADRLPLFVTYLAPGEVSRELSFEPMDDDSMEGDEEMVISILPFLDYTPGIPDAARGRIVDNEMRPAAVLFEDLLEVDSSAEWSLRFGANNGIFDATLLWAFDYSVLGIGPAPNTTDGSTLGLYVELNKTNNTPGGSAGINLYPNGQRFRGNYALRFDLLLSYNPALTGTAEHALAGLNHSGVLPNRVTQSTDTNETTRGGDGIFIAIQNDGGGSRDWAVYTVTNAFTVPLLLTNRTAASTASLISSPPYGAPGAPGVSPTSSAVWSEVELSQLNDIITLKLNHAVIYSFPNPTEYREGSVMIGYNDQIDSIGAIGNFALFDNVRVVSLDLIITRTLLASDDRIALEFASPLGGVAEDFVLERADRLDASTWSVETEAIISPIDRGFRVEAPFDGTTRFYRVRR